MRGRSTRRLASARRIGARSRDARTRGRRARAGQARASKAISRAHERTRWRTSAEETTPTRGSCSGRSRSSRAISCRPRNAIAARSRSCPITPPLTRRSRWCSRSAARWRRRARTSRPRSRPRAWANSYGCARNVSARRSPSVAWCFQPSAWPRPSWARARARRGRAIDRRDHGRGHLSRERPRDAQGALAALRARRRGERRAVP